eukprot:scpid105347/ scgid35377/ 
MLFSYQDLVIPGATGSDTTSVARCVNHIDEYAYYGARKLRMCKCWQAMQNQCVCLYPPSFFMLPMNTRSHVASSLIYILNRPGDGAMVKPCCTVTRELITSMSPVC